MKSSKLMAVLLGLVLVFVICGAAFAADKAPKDVIILKGNPMGGVKFMHSAHTKDRNIKCETCHHASKPEKPLTSAHQACTDCHTKTAEPPMKTKLQACFHNPTAQAGTCMVIVTVA